MFTHSSKFCMIPTILIYFDLFTFSAKNYIWNIFVALPWLIDRPLKKSEILPNLSQTFWKKFQCFSWIKISWPPSKNLMHNMYLKYQLWDEPFIMNVQLETSKLNEATNFIMIEAIQQPFSFLYDNLWVWKKNCKVGYPASYYWEIQSYIWKLNCFYLTNDFVKCVQKLALFLS